MTDPFAQAIHDAHFGDTQGPLLGCNGEETVEHRIEPTYLGAYTAEGAVGDWFESWLDGPLLDMGAGAGRHALYFQEQFETIAIERNELLVETMQDRGVRDARVADMFALRDAFDRDRFASALAIGTQMSLSRSMQGLRKFLGDLASVTTPDGTAILDGFDPDHEKTTEMIDYFSDPTDGLAYRVLQFEYDGTLGEPWLYRLFTPDRVREAAVGTDWEIADVRYGSNGWEHNYRLALQKR